MLYLIFDSADILRCVSQSWPMARSVLDYLCAQDTGCPRLEIHAGVSLSYVDPCLDIPGHLN